MHVDQWPLLLVQLNVIFFTDLAKLFVTKQVAFCYTQTMVLNICKFILQPELKVPKYGILYRIPWVLPSLVERRMSCPKCKDY